VTSSLLILQLSIPLEPHEWTDVARESDRAVFRGQPSQVIGVPIRAANGPDAAAREAQAGHHDALRFLARRPILEHAASAVSAKTEKYE
jgi:hypothetical protein